VISRLVGVGLIAATLWDVFNDLFHPSAHSAFGDWLARKLFNLLRHVRGMLGVAGPLSVVLIILSWVLGLVLGFTFIFLPAFPAHFLTSTGEVPPNLRHS
jgi:predicted PurR-regulated permease PerM